MSTRFIVVPQWQGSSSARAMRLVDGADAIRGDLPSGATTVIDIPLEAGDSQGSAVHRLSSIAMVRDRLAEALAAGSEPAITIGGDCGVELAAISHVVADDVAVVWFDAHPDLNTPESSPSGAFTGMVLRALLGEGAQTLVASTPLSPDRVILVGARAFDPGEDEYLAATPIRVVETTPSWADDVVTAVEQTGATRVYIHIDVDVIDPADFAGIGSPEPFGLPAADLVAAVRALTTRFELAGAGITEFAPASPGDAVEDMPTILRLVAALTAQH